MDVVECAVDDLVGLSNNQHNMDDTSEPFEAIADSQDTLTDDDLGDFLEDSHNNASQDSNVTIECFAVVASQESALEDALDVQTDAKDPKEGAETEAIELDSVVSDPKPTASNDDNEKEAFVEHKEDDAGGESKEILVLDVENDTEEPTIVEAPRRSGRERKEKKNFANEQAGEKPSKAAVSSKNTCSGRASRAAAASRSSGTKLTAKAKSTGKSTGKRPALTSKPPPSKKNKKAPPKAAPKPPPKAAAPSFHVQACLVPLLGGKDPFKLNKPDLVVLLDNIATQLDRSQDENGTLAATVQKLTDDLENKRKALRELRTANTELRSTNAKRNRENAALKESKATRN